MSLQPVFAFRQECFGLCPKVRTCALGDYGPNHDVSGEIGAKHERMPIGDSERVRLVVIGESCCNPYGGAQARAPAPTRAHVYGLV
jgi:hypothetical protein